MTYSLSDTRRKEFATWYLLDRMINKKITYPLMLEGDDTHLEDLLTFMMSNSYVDIREDRDYIATPKGREALLSFKRRYKDFLKNFDVYCAVDLGEGEFAFEEYFEYEDEDLWDEFLEEERWEDLRVAVALFKGLDPLEIVFMGFLNEGRIDDKAAGWQFDLLLGSIWDDIIAVCNSALKAEQLGYDDEEGPVSGEEVLKDIIHQGSKLNRELWEEEEESNQPPPLPGARVVRAEPIKPEVYKRYADDPTYISPVWKKK